MAYTKYSLTPANNNAAPPDGAPEGMLPSAVNDTMRDMMAQIRDVGDGIRGGTYTMTAPVITGGSVTGATINNSVIGGTTAAAGSFTTITGTNDASISGLTVGKGGGAVVGNTVLGTSALGSNANAVAITAIGYQAGFTMNPAAGTYNNTFIGYQSGYSNTAGYNNVFLGGASGFSTTTGGQNTAQGFQALYSNTTAFNNTAIGYQAGYTNTTGTGNSAVGMQSLYSNSTGSSNTAVGQNALNSNTTASNNTAVGYQAGLNNVTGENNLFVGMNAGNATTSGNNTIVGRSAGESVTSGGFNTLIGNIAGADITTGAKNTVLGRYNGNQGGLDIRTASNHIVLSDGDGNPYAYWDNTGAMYLGGVATFPTWSSRQYIYDTNSYNVGIYMLTNVTGVQSRIFFNNPNGNVGQISTSGSSTSFTTSSDYRLKENIAPMEGALNRVAQLKPVTYKWKIDGTSGEGFIAHELAEVVPDAVIGEKDAVNEDGSIKSQGIDTSFLVATLTAAIQELNAKVDAQALEIATIKGN
jgi:hypothetical protein